MSPPQSTRSAMPPVHVPASCRVGGGAAGTWTSTWLRWRSSGRTQRPQREDWNDHLLAARCLRVCGRCPRRDELARDGRRRRRVSGPVAVPWSWLDRTGLCDRRASRGAADGRDCGRRQEGFRGGGPARQPDSAQPEARSRVPLRGRDGRGSAPYRGLPGPVDVLDAGRDLLLLAGSARRAQLRAHARRDPSRRHRAPASGQDAGRRAVPDGDRVLRLQRGRAAQSH